MSESTMKRRSFLGLIGVVAAAPAVTLPAAAEEPEQIAAWSCQGGLHVVVTAKGKVLTSTDGVNWEPRDMTDGGN